jgi:hypothetical protein
VRYCQILRVRSSGGPQRGGLSVKRGAGRGEREAGSVKRVAVHPRYPVGVRRGDREKFTLRSHHFVLNVFGQLLLITDYADYTDLGIRVYKRMRIYL